tara:strand:- start:3611 stop:4252 length:642 start_codon:yes stop_codon:yes gene_type:complete
MPVLIDVNAETELARIDRDYEKGVPLIIPKEQQAEVVYTSYISMNKDRADWQPEGEWMQQVTTDLTAGSRRQPRLLVAGLDGEPRPLSIDDGLIVTLVATMSRIVGILPGRTPMSLDEVDMYLDANPEEDVPTFQEWQFRVTHVAKTDGPEGRANMLRSEEKKRISSQTEMIDTFTEMFKAGFASIGAQGIGAPDLSKAIEAGKAAGVIKKES